MTQQPGSLEELARLFADGQIDRATFLAKAAAFHAALSGSGALAQGPGAMAVGPQGVAIDGDNRGDINTGRQLAAAEGSRIVYAEAGATIVIGDAPVVMTAVDRESVLGKYLRHLVSQNRYLQLQGIRSGGKLVNIELDRIYVTLRAARHGAQRAEAEWLAHEGAKAPGELHRDRESPQHADTTHVTVNEALAEHKRLVVLGDPGCGKTTLLRYLALLHARDLAEGTKVVDDKIGLAESGALPILLPLRQIGQFLTEHHTPEDGTEGHAILLHFLARVLNNERIEVPIHFFDEWLVGGRATVLLDGLDEVADPALRRRVSRLVDAFTVAYPKCRFVVTSRIVGYTDASQLTEGFATTTVRDFTMDDVRAFLSQWQRLVAIGQMGPGETAEAAAASQTRQLLGSIEKNERVRELAINPLMLTVIALIHRDHVKLPDRRAELYQEAVDVLLGKWDEARGVKEALILNDRAFDIGDRRLVLQHLALTMHEQGLKEIDAEPLRAVLTRQLGDAVPDPRDLEATVARFLLVIQERTGLLIARAEGTYAFSHLTFQEYLAARSLAGRDDYVEYSLRRTPDEWWREVILLEAGHLSTEGKEKTTRLIRAIADAKAEPAPHHNLVLAAECVRDAGANRVTGDLEAELRARLRHELETPVARGLFGAVHTLFTRGISPEAAIKRRIAAAEALAKIGGNQFWAPPHGEPEWVSIPPGVFTMGEGSEAERADLSEYAISRVPITNAQFQTFVLATDRDPPSHWNGTRAQRGKESHPVVEVNWHDAMAYCAWLSEALGKTITLPSEAEWEKAARGADDTRVYPWGNSFDSVRCNVGESGFGGTTPVGIFANGASPYGCLDMAGNVWEWTRSKYANDFRNAVQEETRPGNDGDAWVVRGGSWINSRDFARCADRGRLQVRLLLPTCSTAHKSVRCSGIAEEDLVRRAVHTRRTAVLAVGTDDDRVAGNSHGNTKVIVRLRGADGGWFQIGLLGPFPRTAPEDIGRSGAGGGFIGCAVHAQAAAAFERSPDHCRVTQNCHRVTEPITGLRSPDVGRLQIRLLSPYACVACKDESGACEGSTFVGRTIHAHCAAILPVSPDDQRVARDSHGDPKGIIELRGADGGRFQVRLLGPRLRATGKNVGCAGGVRFLVGHAVNARRAAGFTRSPDDHRVSRNAYRRAEEITLLRGANGRGLQIRLLGPKAGAAGENVGRARGARLLVGYAVDARRAARLVGRADHHGIARDRN